MKKSVFMFIAVILMSFNVYADDLPKLKSKAWVIMDMDSGRVLAENNGSEPMAMASTTKIMTAIYAIEHGNLADEVVVSKNAAAAPKVKMNLTPGEKISLENLLYALMLESANDSAVAIAEHIDGSVEEFCKNMTLEAEKIGAKDTVFETPNGLDKGKHHSTAEDMAVIAAYALKNDTFRSIIATPRITFSSGKKSYSLVNKDRLLTEYNGAIGVKTGYTGKAGHCFVGAAQKDGITLITVVLASGWGQAGKAAKWSDTKALLNYGFENFENKTVAEKGEELGEFEIEKGYEKFGKAVLKEGLTLPLCKNDRVEKRVLLLPQKAPVKAGDKVGTAEIYINGNRYCSIDAVALNDVLEHTFNSMFFKIFNEWASLGG